MHYPFIQHQMLDLDALFSKYRDNTALVMETENMTFSEFRQRLIQVRQTLEQLDIRPGDHVALYHKNSEIHLLMLLESWIMNFLFIPLNFKTPIQEVLTWIDIDVLVSQMDIQHPDIKKTMHVDQIIPSDTIPSGNEHLSQINMDCETSMIFTSGSTGTPTGVVHTVGNVIYSALGTIENLDLNPKDSWLVSLPMYHVGGLLIFARTLLSGAACILPLDLKQVETAIHYHRPTVVSLVPTQLLRFMESPETRRLLRSAKAILLGGAPAPPWLIDRALDDHIPVIPTYGSTEACAQLTAVAKNSAKDVFHTSGKVLPYREITLAKDGTILVGGKTRFKYYIRNKQKQFPFQDGKFKTADLGKFDDNGNLIVLGRSDLTFISGGENITPGEIEHHLMKIEHITSAVVVPVPHKEFGLVPWAFAETERPMDPEHIRQQLKTRLPAYKIPKKILFLSAEEKQGEMKFKRKLLQKKAEKMALSTGD